MRCAWPAEDRYWPKADAENWSFTGVKASALRSEADIKLILVKGSANDPMRTFGKARASINCLVASDGFGDYFGDISSSYGHVDLERSSVITARCCYRGVDLITTSGRGAGAKLVCIFGGIAFTFTSITVRCI